MGRSGWWREACKFNSYDIEGRRRWLNVAVIAIEDAGRGQDPAQLGEKCEPREEKGMRCRGFEER